MDGPPDRGGGEEGGGEKKPKRALLFRCCFAVLFSLAASFFFSFLVGLLAIAIGGFSCSRPVSVPAQCRVVSSSVDLRSSKVEYKESFSGRTLHAVAEAPKEALPLDCRPTFATAWLTKSKFKVNETYRCRYTPGTYKADIYSDTLFNCRAEDPSAVEMIRRLFVLFLKSMNSFSWEKGGRGGRMILDAVAGIVAGMLFSLCLVILVRIIHISRLALARKWEAGKAHVVVLAARFRRACLLVAYISAMCWLTLQYSKLIGLKQLLFDAYLGERTM